MKIKTKAIFTLAFFLSLFSYSNLVSAHCPLCTAAAGVAVAAARYYGVNDLIVGTFIGGFIISTAFWFNRVLRKKNKGKDFIPLQLAIMILLSFVTTFISFYTGGIVSLSKLFGVDRIFLGMLLGSVISLFAYGFNGFIRRTHGDKNYIPFQVIIITFSFLLLSVFGYYSFGWV